MSSNFDSKNICWICRRPYKEHNEEDWAKCAKESVLRLELQKSRGEINKTKQTKRSNKKLKLVKVVKQ